VMDQVLGCLAMLAVELVCDLLRHVNPVQADSCRSGHNSIECDSSGDGR